MSKPRIVSLKALAGRNTEFYSMLDRKKKKSGGGGVQECYTKWSSRSLKCISLISGSLGSCFIFCYDCLTVGMGTYLSTLKMILLYTIDFGTTPNGFYPRNTRKRGKSFHYKVSRNSLRLKEKWSQRQWEPRTLIITSLLMLTLNWDVSNFLKIIK